MDIPAVRVLEAPAECSALAVQQDQAALAVSQMASAGGEAHHEAVLSGPYAVSCQVPDRIPASPGQSARPGMPAALPGVAQGQGT